MSLAGWGKGALLDYTSLTSLGDRNIFCPLGSLVSMRRAGQSSVWASVLLPHLQGRPFPTTVTFVLMSSRNLLPLIRLQIINASIPAADKP